MRHRESKRSTLCLLVLIFLTIVTSGAFAKDTALSKDAVEGLCRVACEGGVRHLKLFCGFAPLPPAAKAVCYGIMKGMSLHGSQSQGAWTSTVQQQPPGTLAPPPPSLGIKVCATMCVTIAAAVEPYTENLSRMQFPLLSRL
mmetsp:Transcript_8916/g.10042  ORF Transcript_8916/g.10042 Transcript_8916/m.10042 type:complete len:142 (-) Transcript_8916:85-510(-)